MDFEDRPAWRYQWRTLVLAIGFVFGAGAWLYLSPADFEGRRLVAGLLAGVGVLLGLVAVYRRYKYRYQIKQGVVEAREGILARKVDALRLENLRHVEVAQGIWQRVLGVGDIRFASAGTDKTEIVFQGLLRPERLRQTMQEEIDALEDDEPPTSTARADASGNSVFCSNCGEEVEASANFCPECGSAV